MADETSYFDLHAGLTKAEATDQRSGEKLSLSTKAGSHCLFFDRFQLGGYEIQLRLDWGDLDSTGSPTLDADFYKPDTGKKGKSKSLKSVHHTTAEMSNGRCYKWSFSEKDLDILVAIFWSVHIKETASATDECSAVVIMGNSEK